MNPIIISASRATDIPSFYSKWFQARWKEKVVARTNPYNKKLYKIDLSDAKVVVFWTKNPKPMMKDNYMDFLFKEVKNFYFQYTLNNYELENLEPFIPKLEFRINTFKELSNKIGKDKVIWRFDPLVLTDTLDVKELLSRVEYIGDKLHNYTNKLVFSFADIKGYNKVSNNMKSVNYIEFTKETMLEFSKGLNTLNKKWNLELSTCSENIDLTKYNVNPNKCVDDKLMLKLFPHDKELVEWLNGKGGRKDKGQRITCGCVVSRDIGEYNTCPHGCTYCYANESKEKALSNYSLNKNNLGLSMLKG